MGVGLGWRRMHSSNPYISGQAWSDKVTRSGNTVSYSLNLCMKVEKASGYWDYIWYVDMQVGSNTSNNRKVKNNTSWHQIIGGKEYYQSTFNGNFTGSINVSGKATSIQLRAQFHDSNGNRGPNVYWNVPIPTATSMDDIKKEVSGVGSDIASISAKVTKTGNYSTITSWKLEYGVRNYSENVKTISGNNLSVNWLLENLLADTNYEYRITVSNSSGYSKQATGVFRTEEEVIGYRVTKGELIEPGVYEDGEASGEFVQIDNTYENEGQITSVEMLGNAEQTTYSGKNLASIETSATKTIGGVAFTIVDGVLNISSGTTAGYTNFYFDSFRVPNSGASVLWLEASGYTPAPSDGCVLMLQESADNSTWTNKAQQSWGSPTTQNITLDNTKYYRIRIYAPPSVSFNNAKIKFQLEYGTKTDFEPYCGGVPSPNPDYPQDVNVVTGENVVKVVGKNLFDQSTLEQGGFNYNTGDEYASAVTLRTAKITVSPSTSYTISANAGLGELAWVFYGSDGTTVIAGNRYSANATKSYTITTGSSAHYIRIRWGSSSYPFTLGTDYNEQLELGSTATAYEPYQGQEFPIDLGSIELAKIGNYQDRIYKQDAKWYVEKQTGKIASYAGETISTDYISTTGSLTTGATVYYALATPTTTEITNSELVGQLERLGVATLYVGLNNVLVATNNVAPTLKIDYKLTVKEPVYDDRSDELVGWIIYPDGRKKKIKEIRRVYPT